MANAHGNKCKKQKPAVICCQENVKEKKIMCMKGMGIK